MSEIELEFESRFIPQICCGWKIRTWRRSQHGNPGDVFSVEYRGRTYRFEIQSVEPMTWTEFIERYWCSDGFSSEADAYEYFNGHYLTPGGNPIDYSMSGFSHLFYKLRNEEE